MKKDVELFNEVVKSLKRKGVYFDAEPDIKKKVTTALLELIKSLPEDKEELLRSYEDGSLWNEFKWYGSERGLEADARVWKKYLNYADKFMKELIDIF